MRSAIAAFCFTMVLQAPVLAQVARVEIHTVPSVTMSDQDFLNGRKDGKPVMLGGSLRIPRPGTDRLPAVLVLHGWGGGGRTPVASVPELNAPGVPTFVPAAITPRGSPQTRSHRAH